MSYNLDTEHILSVGTEAAGLRLVFQSSTPYSMLHSPRDALSCLYIDHCDVSLYDRYCWLLQGLVRKCHLQRKVVLEW